MCDMGGQGEYFISPIDYTCSSSETTDERENLETLYGIAVAPYHLRKHWGARLQ